MRGCLAKAVPTRSIGIGNGNIGIGYSDVVGVLYTSITLCEAVSLRQSQRGL